MRISFGWWRYVAGRAGGELQPNRRFSPGLLVGLAALLAVPAAFAKPVEVALSRDFAVVGEPVQLELTVTGNGEVRVPSNIDVPGLDIRLANQSRQMQMTLTNGRISSTVVTAYTYLVIPLKRGDYTIPSLSVQVGGQKVRTSPLTLRVGVDHGGVPVLPATPVTPSQVPPVSTPQSAPPASAPPSSLPPGAADQVAFGDLIVPKTSAYVGEVVPLEIRFYFDAGYPVRLQERPRFSGDGFTVMRFSEHSETQQEINGRRFNVISFKTAITPAKAGPLEIPAATIESRIQFPSSGSRRDDLFGGLLGQMGFADERDVTVSTPAVQLEVKALPADRPDSFAGAVGQFSLSATATPKKVDTGEPISLVVTVSGRGNFDAMGAPALVQTEGWRTYPPGEKFFPSPGDQIGYSGEKQFDCMIVAREARTETPVAELTFFDPDLEQFVTLKSPPIAVEAAGGAAPAPVASAGTPSATPAPTASPPASAESVLSTKFLPATFTPFAWNRIFLAANGVVAGGWLLFLLWGIGRKVSGSALARGSALRREARSLLRQVEATEDPQTFYELVPAFVAQRLQATPAALRDAVAVARMSEEARAAISSLLDACDERRYSTHQATRLSADEKRSVVAQLKSFDAEIK